jgi:DNA invertase Pin-like site-specific DNA recombinase
MEAATRHVTREHTAAVDTATVLGYVRVEAPHSRDFAVHAAAIRAWCAEQQLELVDIVREVGTGRGLTANRPSLFWSLRRIASGEAKALVAARLDHLTTTAGELASIIDWFVAIDRRLILLDVRLDTSTGAGRLAAETLSAVGSLERERIASRTREALEAARSRGEPSGRPAVADIPALKDRIRSMRDEGMSLRAIADVLNAEGVPTVRGGAKWRPSSIHAATGYRRPSSGRRIDLPPTES